MSFSVLIVNKDPVFCEQLRDALDGYSTTSVSSPQQALNVLRNPNCVDLVLLEIRASDMKSTNLLKTLKELHPDVPVIIMTAFASKDMAIRALRCGADDLFEKPFDVEQLNECIGQLLQSKSVIGVSSSDMDYVRYYLRRNIDIRVAIAEIAQLMGYTPKYMSAFFKRKTGKTFTEFCVDQRVEKAKALLADSDYPVKQIAYDLAYENPESFVRVFKRKTRLTPSQYRTKLAELSSSGP